MEIYTPKQAALSVGIHDNTIRLWVKEYANHLSPNANPISGQPRQLTPEDVSKLQAIKGWKDAGLQPEAILERLATLSTDELQKPYIEATASPPMVLQQPTSDNQALVVAIANLADVRPQVERVLDAVQELDRRIEERVAQVKEEVKQETDQKLLQYRNMLIMLGLFAILLGIAVIVLVAQR